MSLESVRQWISTLGLAALGLGVLLLALRPPATARAEEPAAVVAPPSCHLVDSGKLAWEKAGEDVATQATTLLAARGGREHVAVLPYGRMGNGSGGTYSVMCFW